MTTAKDIGQKLVAFCNAGKNEESIRTLYAKDVESVEAAAPPSGGDRTTKGIEAVLAKNKQWSETNQIHSAQTFGPYPHGDDKFAVRFVYDITNKQIDKRIQLDEVGVFHVKDGKVVREEFFYDMG